MIAFVIDERLVWGCLILGLAFVGLGYLSHEFGVWLGVKLRAWLLQRTRARTDALKPLMGKLVRHARTGRVGLCAGIGAGKDERWGAYRPRAVLMVCFCADCNRRMLEAEASGSMGEKMVAHHAAMQCMEYPPADECTVAPSADAAKFRASLGKGEA